jgi:hypothetical protein
VLARGRDDSLSGVTERRRRLLELPRAVLRRFRRLQAQTRREQRRATNIAHALEFCRRVLTRRVVLFLISDFLDDGYLNVLRSANRRHDVVCVHVTDAREMAFERAGLLALEDAESGATRLVDTESAAFRRSLTGEAERRMAQLTAELRASGIDLIRIDATRPVIEPLLAFFRMRERRSRR